MKELNKGIRQAYIGEYIHKIQSIYTSLSSDNKIILLNNLMSSSLSDDIKVNFKEY